MSNNDQIDKKILHKRQGPGGIKCACCGPAPGKKRRRFARRVKRSIRNRIKQILRQQDTP